MIGRTNKILVFPELKIMQRIMEAVSKTFYRVWLIFLPVGAELLKSLN